MTDKILETERLILRNFEKRDLLALFSLLSDEAVNEFLPWFPLKKFEEAEAFFEKHFAGKKYHFAVCLKENDFPIGYVKCECDESHDFGYALAKEFWHKGIATEAAKRLVALLKNDGVPFITATHDKSNPKSGGVMRRLGMKYCYSYIEQWQPKNFPVTFRMYQMNISGEHEVFRKYWNLYEKHFVEEVN